MSDSQKASFLYFTDIRMYSELVFNIIYIKQPDARSKLHSDCECEEKHTLELNRVNGSKLTTMKSKCVCGLANKLIDKQCTVSRNTSNCNTSNLNKYSIFGS